MLISGMIFAQNTNVKPKLEVVNLVILPMYMICTSERRRFKKWETTGQWVSYDVNGNKTAIYAV
jgi:hypothetical protein